ncbi:MAG: RbsD/FucU domain-containing protein [Rikenellaceae bacterium]
MWKSELERLLPLLGHRNWILVVDKAYPLQSAAGMTYINSAEPIEEVLRYVLKSVDAASHIVPIIYTDRELQSLVQFGGAEAQMVESINKLLSGRDVKNILHDDIFTKLDEASKLFNVVVIKTESTVAYSSVFMELDCGYWSLEREQQLRRSL